MQRLLYIAAFIISFVPGYAQEYPHGDYFEMDCSFCHTDEDWNILLDTLIFSHDSTGFELVGQHSVTNCKACHKTLIFENTSMDCISCHTDMHENTNGPDCSRCHTPQHWIIENVQEIHLRSRFPLFGAHSMADCSSCHPSASLLRFEPRGIDCFDCHQANYFSASQPRHSAAGIPTMCEECHEPFTWKPSKFNHSQTDFQLRGAHTRIGQCSDCHEGSLTETESQCFSCHQAQYFRGPRHIAANFPKTCLLCHNNESWGEASFDHDQTNFPLIGVHIETDCSLCHTSGTYSGTPSLCVDCHQANYTGAQNPNHTAAGIPTQCDDCHTPVGWIPSDFDHITTGFELLGAHTEVPQCSDCHLGTLVEAVSECFSCHEVQYNGAPGHLSSVFPKNCLMCHNNDSWEETSFDHDQTNFPLIGVHIETDCSLCHTSGTYSGTPSLCVDCHQANYTGAQNPNHTAAGIPTQCDDCHTPVGWIPSDFDHITTGFELLGAHTEVPQCSDCHLGTLVEAVSECFSCHEVQYNGAPGHLSSVFPKNCLMCHNNDSWEETSFDHDQTNFPLIGVHIETDCSLCHTSGTYSGTPSLCVDCHQANYTGAQNPNHTAAGIPTQCDDCHTPVGWIPSDFDHITTGFELLGAHTEVPQCSDCHLGTLVEAVSECFSCHEVQYNGAPGHLSSVFPKNCLMCHNNDSWEETSFDHDQTNFPLIGVHIETDCSLCHTSGTYSGTPSLCVDCHQANYTGAQNPNHTAAGIPTQCDDCHTPVGWIPSDFDHITTGFELLGAHTEVPQCSDCHLGTLVEAVSECFSCHEVQYNGAPGHLSSVFPKNCLMCHNNDSWEETSFDHDQTNFPLIGVHIETDCSLCHTSGTYSGTPSLCVDCHQANYTGAQNPNHTAAGIPTQCDDCHTPVGWIPSDFDHITTGFELLGAHTEVPQCSDCHLGTLVEAVSECFSCHEVQYNGAPEHLSSGFPKTCELCHNNDSWEDASFDHNITSFPLVGVHTTTECAQCHTSGYAGTPSLCIDCHQANYTGAQFPNHTAAGIPTQCDDCHTPVGWVPSEFDHITTGFELIGSHTTIAQCSDCHLGTLVEAVSECFSCHEVQYNGAPEHLSSGFPKTCELCHNNDSWEDATFDHNITSFPLVGVHTTTECAQCHTSGYAGTPSLCVDCHQANYTGAQFPNHTAAGIPTQCDDCHTPVGWVPSEFDHITTGFELIGSHTTIAQCSDCHLGTLVEAVSECFSCHEVQYNGAPEHLSSGFPKTCELCHNNDSWEDATFDHNITSFPLVGVHTTTECAQCHTSGYAGTPSLCVDCHQANYTGAQFPNHTAAGIPTQCDDCHTPVSWVPSEFDHITTGFELIGSHTTIAQCSDCHLGTLVEAVSECFSCHEVQYNGAPEHLSSGFPKTCELCHNNDSWEDASFDHNITSFPLVGVHTTTECAQCHTSGYAGTPSLCIDCHQANYTGAQFPNHTAAGIPTQCDDCHTPVGWVPSEFDHITTGFELIGSHTTIAQCSDCHLGTLVEAVSECFSCHEVQYNGAPEHLSSGFPKTCELCHNNDSWEDASFDHNITSFPLVGVHTTTECAQCHTSGYAGTPSLCVDCHQANYTGAQFPNHTAAGIPTQCDDCHTPVGWVPSEFDHITTGFELIGSHTTIAQCSDCHLGTLVEASSDCYSCHSANYLGTTDPNHQAAMFPTDCELCHTSSQWEPSTFDHDGLYFPINSGTHQEEWDSCTDCHRVSGNFSLFSCINCHGHPRGQTEHDHSEVEGFEYNSDACLSCHPDGKIH